MRFTLSAASWGGENFTFTEEKAPSLCVGAMSALPPRTSVRRPRTCARPPRTCAEAGISCAAAGISCAEARRTSIRPGSTPPRLCRVACDKAALGSRVGAKLDFGPPRHSSCIPMGDFASTKLTSSLTIQ